MPTLTEQARELKADIDADTATAKTLWTTFDGLRKSAIDEGVDFTKDTDAFGKLDEAGRAYDQARDGIAAKQARWQRLMEVIHADQPAAQDRQERKGEPEAGAALSMGERFVASEEYLEVKDRLSGHGDMRFGDSRPLRLAAAAQVKTLITSTQVGALYQNDVLPIVTPLPTAMLNVLDAIPAGTTDSDTVEWQQEKTWTNNAAETAEGDAAPESALEYESVTAAVQDITHFIPATKRALADAGQAATLINNRMINGVRTRLQKQVIAGDGLGVNLRGMINTPNILTQALGADSRNDAVHKAITKVRVAGEAGYEPNFLVIHPSDWEQVVLDKNVGGDYYYGGPALPQQGRTIWGLTPLVSTAITAGTALMFDSRQVQLWFNGGLDVAMSDSHSDYFIKKKVAIMASLRAAFGVYAPSGIATVTGI
jgi:HK97 family phage major capsid protein